jgi:hypothetical protein
MNRILTALLAAGLAATTIAPFAQAAVHGVDWTATGVIVDGTTVNAVTVHWNGCLGCSFGFFTVTVADPVTNVVLSSQTFAGIGQFQERNSPGGGWAYVLMTGTDYNVSNVDFAVTCHQLNGLGNNRILNEVCTGTFNGDSIYVYALMQPWNFG